MKVKIYSTKILTESFKGQAQQGPPTRLLTP